MTQPKMSTRWQQCVDRIRTITTELEKLSAHDQLTRSQERTFRELREEFEDRDEERKQLERDADLEKIRQAANGGDGFRVEPGAFGGADPHADDAPSSGDRGLTGYPMGAPAGATRDRARRVIDAAFRSHSLPAHGAETATALLDQGMPSQQSLSARWATATGDPAYLSAFTKMVADPVRGHLLWDAREQDAFRAVTGVQSEMRAMSLTDNAGGYMVPLTLDPAIILTSNGSTNPLRRISRVVQTVSDQWQGVSSAGVTAEWKTEGAQAADATPTLAGPSIPIYFGDAFVPYSFEVGMDGIGFLQELQKLLVDAADQLQATAFTTGTGSQPTGIITALTGTASEINAATDDAFAKADVYTLQNALGPRFQANAQWCASLPIINVMSQFETTNGARLFPEISEGRLLNRPLNELSNMDNTITTAGAVSNFILLYGDFSNFVIADRIGSQLEFIQNLVGANQRPTGQRGAMLWFRTGSDSVNDGAFRMLDVASAA